MATTMETLQEKYGFLLPTKNNSANTRMSTPPQHKFYKDLCTQKRVTPMSDEELATKSFNELSTIIDELKDYRPVSLKQLEQINKSLAKLKAVGINPDIDVSTLTGGFEGTASVVLTQLFELVNKHCPPEAMPPSDKQVEFVAKMYLCPSVDFEDLGIERWIYLEDGMKRRPTSEEFAQSIREAFNSSTISDFINKNLAEFNEWLNTRIRPGQLKHILSLLSKHGGSQVDELTLFQFSQDEADAYIKQLIDELKIKIPTSIDRTTQDSPILAQSAKEAVEMGENDLRNTIFGLMVETGCEYDGIDCIKPDELKEWFAYLLDKEFITSGRLLEIISENDVLSDMLAL